MPQSALAQLPARNVSELQNLADRASALNASLRSASAEDILRRAIDEYRGSIALVSSFGAESAILLSLVASIDPNVPVVFLNTGKHFEQTHVYRNHLVKKLGLTDVRNIDPSTAELTQEDPNGDLWRRDTDACCALRKVRPLKSALSAFDAWITGRKRFHGGLREHLPVFEPSPPQMKVNPIVKWSADELADYQTSHDLPPHPLVEQGFPSIGCWPCTQPIADNEDTRAGRWRGAEKTECGIHQL